jgi:hypothetical protein
VEIDVEAAGLAVQGSCLVEEGYTDALEVAGVMLMALIAVRPDKRTFSDAFATFSTLHRKQVAGLAQFDPWTA